MEIEGNQHQPHSCSASRPTCDFLVSPHPHRIAVVVISGNLKKDKYHLERMQRAATRLMKGLRDLYYEERLKALKLQSLEKRRIKNDLALTH